MEEGAWTRDVINNTQQQQQQQQNDGILLNYEIEKVATKALLHRNECPVSPQRHLSSYDTILGVYLQHDTRLFGKPTIQTSSVPAQQVLPMGCSSPPANCGTAAKVSNGGTVICDAFKVGLQ